MILAGKFGLSIVLSRWHPGITVLPRYQEHPGIKAIEGKVPMVETGPWTPNTKES